MHETSPGPETRGFATQPTGVEPPSDSQLDADSLEKVRAGNLASMAMDGRPITGKPRASVQEFPPVFLPKYMPSYWLCRLYVAAQVLVGLLVTLTVQGSVSHALLAQGSTVGALMSLGFLACIAGLCVADVVVNDLMPDRFYLPTVKRFRHVSYMAMALGVTSVGAVVATRHGVSWLLAGYVLDAAMCVAVAYLDLFTRHKKVVLV